MILAIDTSQEKHCLALYAPGRIQKKTCWQRGETSKELLPKIKQFLGQNRVKLKDLRALAVSRGPGSFTGTRVGITVAQTIAYALDIPAFGFKGAILEGAKKAYEKQKKAPKKRSQIKPIYKYRKSK